MVWWNQCGHTAVQCLWTFQYLEETVAWQQHFLCWRFRYVICCSFTSLFGFSGASKPAASQSLIFTRPSKCHRRLSYEIHCRQDFGWTSILSKAKTKVARQCQDGRTGESLLHAWLSIWLSVRLTAGKAFDTVVIARWLRCLVNAAPINPDCVACAAIKSLHAWFSWLNVKHQSVHHRYLPLSWWSYWSGNLTTFTNTSTALQAAGGFPNVRQWS